MQAKYHGTDTKVLLRFTEEELQTLHDGWYTAVKISGERLSRTDYIKFALAYTLKSMQEKEAALNG